MISNFEIVDVTAEYLGWLMDKETNKYLEVRFNKADFDNIVDFVNAARVSKNKIFMKICAPYFVGTCSLNIDHEHRTAEVGIMIGNSHARGRGVGKESLILLLEYAHTILSLRKVSARVYAANYPSIKLFLSLGFRLEARLKGQVLLDDIPEDLEIYSIFFD